MTVINSASSRVLTQIYSFILPKNLIREIRISEIERKISSMVTGTEFGSFFYYAMDDGLNGVGVIIKTYQQIYVLCLHLCIHTKHIRGGWTLLR
jgi:hypothetical protein